MKVGILKICLCAYKSSNLFGIPVLHTAVPESPTAPSITYNKVFCVYFSAMFCARLHSPRGPRCYWNTFMSFIRTITYACITFIILCINSIKYTCIVFVIGFMLCGIESCCGFIILCSLRNITFK